MEPFLDLDGQFVIATQIVAILTPTSEHVSLTDGADITLRSVLVLGDSNQLVPCSLLPRTVARKLGDWYEERMAQVSGGNQPTPKRSEPETDRPERLPRQAGRS